jgi:hypothetical protein
MHFPSLALMDGAWSFWLGDVQPEAGTPTWKELDPAGSQIHTAC